MDNVEWLRVSLKKLSKNKTIILGTNLVERVMRASGKERDAVLLGLQALRKNAEISSPDWHRGEPIGRVTLSIITNESAVEKRWRQVVEQQDLSIDEQTALVPMAGTLEELNPEDMTALIKGLIAIKSDMPKLMGQSRFRVSAQYLMGSSKMIDALPSNPLKEFGINPNLLSGPPSYIVTAGPPNPDCVVLVENPQAFETALDAEGAERVAWVATFGYGLSLSGNEHGDQLASVVEAQRSFASLVRQGSPPKIELLLRHDKIYFWGDLDREGLKIFWRLKSRIPKLQLSGLYRPMLTLLQGGMGHHAYDKLSAKSAQSFWECNDLSVNELLMACAERAVDQEVLDGDTILEFVYDAFT